jgi:2-oxoglutarate ferredoxin oxidoreductase subunit alpha
MMVAQLSWKIGGQQGEGVESTDRIFSTALNRLGYYLYGYRHFSSRIKGGHTNNKIRISVKPIRSISDDLDILVAFDQETIDVNAHELRKGGVIVADAKFSPSASLYPDVTLYPVPITEIAEQLGTSLYKNMVASGASWALLGLPMDIFHKAVEEEFGRKGAAVVAKNIEAVSRGAQFVLDLSGGAVDSFRLGPPDGQSKLFLVGNDAIGLGAVAAGCRFMAAYPITPATEIMEYLVKVLPKFGGAVIQTEDEIAAVTMAIGGNDLVIWAGFVADDGGDWFGGDDRDARRHRRYAARWAFDWIAHKTRAERHQRLNIQHSWRNSENCHRTEYCGRMLLRHDRGV